MPQQMMPHKPTLGWAIVGVIVVVVGYHFFMKGRR
jgi:hypothetical protein